MRRIFQAKAMDRSLDLYNHYYDESIRLTNEADLLPIGDERRSDKVRKATMAAARAVGVLETLQIWQQEIGNDLKEVGDAG